MTTVCDTLAYSGGIIDRMGDSPARRLSKAAERPMRARYDAAQSTDDNSLYWANADDLSARAANSPGVRRILRKRARYEVANNCYAKGMLRSLSDYVIGTGPSLQVLTDDEAFNEAVEQRFHDWARVTGWYRKLWTMRFAWCQDGEAFGVMFANRASRDPVKLDIKLIEADQIADTADFTLMLNRTDGLVLDDFGNVVGYRILKEHPGDALSVTLPTDAETVPADRVIHIFREERAGQLRGVPEITPALMLYPIMRRYTLAALHSAETAAKISGIIRSQFSPVDPDDLEPLDPVELGFNEWLTMPAGWDINQFKSEQPTTQYQMFKREIVSEIARCLNMPFNVAAADSSDANFASGKLDHTTFFKSVGIDQSMIEQKACDPTFERWIGEARRIPGHVPAGPEMPPHTWVWDGMDLLDPREANSAATLLQNGLDSFQRQHAKRGLRTDEVVMSNAKALGMTVEEYQERLRDKLFGPVAEESANVSA